MLNWLARCCINVYGMDAIHMPKYHSQQGCLQMSDGCKSSKEHDAPVQHLFLEWDGLLFQRPKSKSKHSSLVSILIWESASSFIRVALTPSKHQTQAILWQHHPTLQNIPPLAEHHFGPSLARWTQLLVATYRHFSSPKEKLGLAGQTTLG